MSADELREVLGYCGLSQRAAARFLEIDDRMMRYYCAGVLDIPRVVEFAIKFMFLDMTNKAGERERQ